MRALFRRITRAVKSVGWWRFAAGVAAGGAALGLTYLLRLMRIGLFLPDVAVDFVVDRIPGEIEAFVIRTMGEGAKILGLVTALVVFLALSGALAMPFRRVQRRLRNRWTVLLAYAGVYAGAVLLVVLPLLGRGFLGTGTSSGVAFAVLSQILAGALYASVLDYLLVDVASRHPEGFSPSRRQFIAGLGVLLFAGAVAVAGFGSFLGRSARLTFARVEDLLAREVTPNEEFYRVTKNAVDPDVDPGSWRLTVDGLVTTQRTYTLQDLEAQVAATEHVTLECISNEVGGNLISTAGWRGIRLADLLGASGVDARADWVAFSCADGYTVGVPLARAMAPRSLLALRMNDATLPRDHGFPARAIVPGLYGMFHAKWITRISLVQGEFIGFWQQKGWSNRGEIRTTAIITTPAPDAIVRGTATIAGVAFAGDRGIARVEVSADGGTTWADANIVPSALTGTLWVLWTYDWTPPAAGAYRILARATDAGGIVQELASVPPFPDGAAGYDAITLLVS